MKILKEGSLPNKKFTCPVCRCEFVADTHDCELSIVENLMVRCPFDRCGCVMPWGSGVPYENKPDYMDLRLIYDVVDKSLYVETKDTGDRYSVPALLDAGMISTCNNDHPDWVPFSENPQALFDLFDKIYVK